VVKVRLHSAGDDLFALAGLERGAAVLEIGCGTGQALTHATPKQIPSASLEQIAVCDSKTT
jgi:cyclopropane fatty-acyl-phospholipid synthase-like methyltransferase